MNNYDKKKKYKITKEWEDVIPQRCLNQEAAKLGFSTFSSFFTIQFCKVSSLFLTKESSP